MLHSPNQQPCIKVAQRVSDSSAALDVRRAFASVAPLLKRADWSGDVFGSALFGYKIAADANGGVSGHEPKRKWGHSK